MLESILNFFFPASCILCGKGNISICESCFNDIPLKIHTRDNIVSFYQYNDPRINKLIKRLKYYHDLHIAKTFGMAIQSHLKKTLSSNSILIPIPLSISDIRMNNHAEIFANNLDFKVLPNILVKKSKVKQAHTKGRAERLENIKGTFSINPKFKNENKSFFVIVDDVYTSGATINEARTVLAKHFQISNPKEILAITIAH